MKTSIEILEHAKDYVSYDRTFRGDVIPYISPELLRAIDDGISALCAQRGKSVEIDQFKPLALDELREMAQKCEGVYVTHVDGSPVFRGQRFCAAVLDISPAFGRTTLQVHAIYGDRLTLWEDEYGKTWMAYRRKPEEGTT